MKIVFVLFIAACVAVAARELGAGLVPEGYTPRDEKSGSCGESVSWVFDSASSTLTISGTGRMACCNDTYPNYCPWYHFIEDVKTLDTAKEKPTSTSDVSGNVSGSDRNDVSDDDSDDDDTPKHRKPEWKDEALKAIPSFECVQNNSIPVEDWCASALRLADEFSGSETMKVRALRDAIPIEEFKGDIDLTQFTVVSFLARVIRVWRDTVGNGRVTAVMCKSPSQTWVAFRLELIKWSAKHGVSTPDSWLLAQMRANTELHRDILGATNVNSATWARVMDRTETMYGHARQDVQATRPVASIEEPAEIDAVKRTRTKHKFTATGVPICDQCHKPGHLRRNCPRRKIRQTRK